MAALLALGSALWYGVSDFSGGLAARRAPAVAVVLVSNGLALLLAAFAVAALPGSSYSSRDLAWGAAAGTVGLLGVVLLYRGLAIGPMSVVAPLTAVLAAVVPVVVGIVRGDRPGAPAFAGIVLAGAAIALVARERARPAGGSTHIGSTALLSALLAGVSFGGFYVLLAQTGSDGGAWPLLGQRAASVALLLGFAGTALVRGRQAVPHGTALWLALLAGVTDFLANLAYVLATHRGLLALVAVLSSLYPVATVLLARAVLRERLTREQLAGIGVAVLAVTLIALR